MNRTDVFKEFAASFERKIDSNYQIALQFEIIDESVDNFFQVKVSQGKVAIYTSEMIEVEESWIMSSKTLEDLYYGRLSPLSAYANEPDQFGNMRAFIELKERTDEKKVFIKSNADQRKPNYSLISRNFKFADFFNLDEVCRVRVNKENSRILHGVKAVGLHNGFEQSDDYLKEGHLHACFYIEKDEVLRQPPIEKSIFVVNGEGEVKMDGVIHRIMKDNYFRLFPMTSEKIEIRNSNSETLQILYI